MTPWVLFGGLVGFVIGVLFTMLLFNLGAA